MHVDDGDALPEESRSAGSRRAIPHRPGYSYSFASLLRPCDLVMRDEAFSIDEEAIVVLVRNAVSGSFASYVVCPTGVMSGIGRTSRLSCGSLDKVPPDRNGGPVISSVCRPSAAV